MASSVESLVQQCQFYILMHLEEFPVDYLSLLPLSTRKVLLWQLPLADVVQLQDTRFTEGLEAVVVDCFLSRCDTNYVGTGDLDGDVARYVKNRWKNAEMAHARELLYGRLVTSLLECLRRDKYVYFKLPNGELVELKMCDNHHMHCIADFLCGIRKKYESQPMSANNFPVRTRGDFPVPPRYYNSVRCPISTFEWMVKHFNGKHPKVIDRMYLPTHYDGMPLRTPYCPPSLPILREVEQLGFEYWLNEDAAKFIAETVSSAKHLEVLILRENEYMDDDDHIDACIDTLCSSLTVCSATFWSTFRIFKILSRLLVVQYDDGEIKYETSDLGYVISRGTFDKLIEAYLAAPTDHEQIVQFTDTKIEGDSSDQSPAINTTYLKFKTIRLENCHFVTKAMPETIASWLGREIDVLENKPDSCSFQVKDSSDKRGQKRKHSEE